MHWRPDGWKNPCVLIILTEKQVLKGTTTETEGYDRRTIPDPVYEAGADALLKALRKTGWHVTDECLPARKNGTWVFIPDGG